MRSTTSLQDQLRRGLLSSLLAFAVAIAGAGSAQAQIPAAISGTVTGPGGTPADCVEISADSEGVFGGTTFAEPDGTYYLDVEVGESGSDFLVRFQDCGDQGLETEWYDDAKDIADADPVHVSPGVPRTGVNAQLAPDTDPPDSFFTDGPQPFDNDPNPTFTFDADEPGATFECSLDDPSEAAYEDCTSPVSLSGVTDGDHTFYVRATDASGNTDPTPAQYDFTVDFDPPETTIETGPAGTVTSSTASFTFYSSDPNSTFVCQLDEGPVEPCSSPQTYSNVPNGLHEFKVRAQDQAGNTDSSFATRSFTVDVEGEADPPPDTVIDDGPDGTINVDDTEISFHSTEPNSTFICQLDAGEWVQCTSPHQLVDLDDGAHVLRVRAIDSVGGIDPTADEWNFNVDTSVPDTTIDDGPSGPHNSTSATFSFSSDESGASFECKLDEGGFVPCSSPETYSSLAPGEHTFIVRAYDAGGNRDASPDQSTFTVPADTTPPETTISSGPTGATQNANPVFAFGSSEGGSTFACRLDGGSFSPCTSPRGLSGLSDGQHTFEVKATDAFGNEDPTPASRTFRVDTTAPESTIDSGPSGSVTGGSASFSFSASEGASFQCSLDGGAFAACTSPKSYSGLAAGPHTFSVRAVDQAGNVEGSPTSRTFTVESAPPPVDPGASPECAAARATLDKAKAALKKAQAKAKKAKTAAAKKKAKAKVKKAKAKVKQANAGVADACS